MNMRIFRYPLNVGDESVYLPGGSRAKILDFAARDQLPDIVEFWALVDADLPDEPVRFHVYGTGHPIYQDDVENMEYLKSVITAGGALVWHIFREGPWYGI